jgi:hypothetical protein
MIDYTARKRFYTTGGEFTTLSGGDYVGYVVTLSGVPYIDKYIAPLTPTTTYESNLYTSKYLKNRDINEPFSVPYNSFEILFGANDFLTHSLLIDKLGKLHDNNTFVYSKLFMASNDLPVRMLSAGNLADYTYACLPTSNTLSLTAVSSLVQSVPFASSSIESFRALGNIRRFAAKLKDDTPTDYTIYAITSGGFTTLSGNNRVCQVIEPHSRFIESTQNELTFGSLFDISLSRNFIFITDELNSVIYKYDIGGYYNGDLALANKRNLLEILGGDGPQGSKNLFKSPKHIASNDDVIIVNDSGNSVIKVFDLNFNFITRIGSIPLTREPVVALQINEFYNNLYVFTREIKSKKLNLYIIDLDCFRIQETYKDIAVPLQETETIANVEFSKNNSDYYYICTDRQVYKLFVSKPNVLIGRYQELNTDYISGTKTVQSGDKVGTESYLKERKASTPDNQWGIVSKSYSNGNWAWGAAAGTTYIDVYAIRDVYATTTTQVPNIVIFNDVYKGISFLPTSNNFDSVVFITDGRIYFYNEPNEFKQVIKTNKLQKFGKINMTLSSEEYIQASTINKELYKVVRDILVLKNNLVGRFTGEYDTSNIFTLTDYNYNLDFNSFSLIQPEDYYVHENEKALVTVINRAFRNILDLQEKLINLTAVDKGITVKKELTVTPYNSAIEIS